MGFREQPGVVDHIQYMIALSKEGVLAAGGPFLDDSGGMMISTISDLSRATEIACKDPAVIAGLLQVEVKSWMIPISSDEFSIPSN